ncbi:hypothetical protein LOTGIDRAFT_233565 [Lottia gigantea]|uniref:PH domain-containing protein n=1 Tax=Lottia gigantea TaxID=225164 RepID=V3ZIH9_LOTGI|nr:hypothetical protein LOTGIDRAFT_233565 [Lottia gigantea]ESO91088.1 hypothetical protein LOTGIDRAFT_233565 [Lottia gigantea]
MNPVVARKGGNNWNSKWCILMAGSSTSPACLYKYDSKGDTKHPKILDLHKLSKVEKYRDSKITFEVVIKSDNHFFKCENETEQESWIQAFAQILQSRDRCSKANTVSGGDLIVEDNFLYNSVDDTQLFKVKVNENDDSKRIGLKPDTDYYLAVFLTYIALLDSTKKQLYQWSYEHIKSFGRLPDTFQIQSGRRTSTGNGVFSFNTTEGDLIYESVHKQTKTMRSYNSNESINTARSSPQPSQNEQSKSLNPSHLSKSMSFKASHEAKEEKSHLSKSVNDETSHSIHVNNDNLKKNFEQNLKQVLIKQHSIGEESNKQVFKGSTESQVGTKSLKREKEKERKQREKKQKEEQKEKERRAKEEAKKQEKEKKAREKEMKKNKGMNSRPKSQSHLYCNPGNAYEEVDDVRMPSIDSASAYALPQDNIPTSKLSVENHYAEPDNIQGARKSTEKPSMYETADQERSEAWRQFGRDTDNLHEEDYENIRIAAKNPEIIEGDYDMPEELCPNAPSIPTDVDDETYDHISSFDFKPSRKSGIARPESEVDENIYGDNSGTKIETRQTASSSEYEEASTVQVKSLQI